MARTVTPPVFAPPVFAAATVAISLICCGPVAADYLTGMEAYRKAQAAYAAQQYAEARRWAERAVAADPETPHAYALLGNLRYLARDAQSAEAAWRRALSLNPRLEPLRERLAQLAQERALEQERARMTAGPFVVWIAHGSGSSERGSADPLDAAAIMEELQRAQTDLESRFGWRLRGPIRVLVYAPTDFVSGLHAPTAVAGLFDDTVRLLVPAVVGAAAPDNPEETARLVRELLWHELAHVLVHQLSQGRAPRWVHEGIALVVEDGVSPLNRESLQLPLKRDELPTIPQLEEAGVQASSPLDPDGLLFDMACWAHMKFLLDRAGWAGLHQCLVELAHEASTTTALERVVQLSEDAWDRQWRRWLQGGGAWKSP